MQCGAYACPGGRTLGTFVTISGSLFDANGVLASFAAFPSAYECSFNGTRVPATIQSGRVVSCYAPGSVHTGATSLRLSLNGQQLSQKDVLYRFVSPVTSSITPSLGPASGELHAPCLPL